MEKSHFTSKLTFRMTSNHQDNKINGFTIQNPQRRCITRDPSFISFPLDLSTLMMTFNNQNSTINGLFNQNHTKSRSKSHEKDIKHLFLFVFLKNRVSIKSFFLPWN